MSALPDGAIPTAADIRFLIQTRILQNFTVNVNVKVKVKAKVKVKVKATVT